MSDSAETIRNCGVCGADLPADTVRGLCPRCLLLAGMEVETGRHLHVRCPQCHVAIEIVDDASLKEVTCPSCDSRFSLIGEHTATYTPDQSVSIGRFELLERVGVGAFGSVWKARDPELDRVVAVKIPRKEQLDTQEVEQFAREARSAAQLKHPGIVAVHEVGRDGDRLYLVSDFVEGVTLADWLSARQPTAREAAELCMQIAEALQHAHEQGVIHRDLKPSNIILGDDGRPHVMDFGLAKRVAAEVTMTIDGRILGTPAYMSPEQARGEAHQADARSDVYSLGVVLFELLTGERPFRGTSRMLLHQVLHDDAPRPQSLNNRVSRDLETICLKCLEKDPARRYQSAGEMAEELQRFLNGRPILARPITRLHRVWRWCRRNRLAAGLSALVVASLLAGTSVSTYFAIEETKRARDERDARLLADQRQREANDARIAERKARIESDRQAELARRTAYGLQLSRAQFHLQQDPELARRLLEDESLCPTDLRDFGWRHLHHAASLEVARFDATDRLRFASDGNTAVYLSADRRRVVSHDLRNREETILYAVDDDAECLVTFSADLTRVVTADRESWHKERFRKAHVLSTRHLPTGELLATHDASDAPIERIEISPDGASLAVRTAAGITVRDVKTLDVTATVPEPKWNSEMAFTPDAQLLATVSDRGIEFTDLETGAHRRTIPTDLSTTAFITFSPDGQVMAAGGENVQVWDLGSGTLSRTINEGVGTNFTAAALSPDGQTLAVSTSEYPIGLWDLRNGTKWASLTGSHSDGPLVFSADGRLLASRGKKVWRVPDQDDPAEELATGPQPMITLWPNDRTVMAGMEGPPRFWDTESGNEVQVLELTETYCHGVSPDGTRLAVAGREQISVFRSEDLARIHEFDCEMPYRVAFSSDNQLLAATPINSPFIDLWDVDTGEKLARWGAEDLCVISLAFSPDGTYLAAGMGFQPAPENPVGRVDIWDVKQGQIVTTLSGFRYGVYAVAFSPDGRSLAAASQRIRVWSVPDWTERFSIDGHQNIVWGLAYSPDGRSLASGSFDGTVKLWDPETGHERVTLGTHGYWVLGLEFARDGSLLATCSSDGVKLWRAD